MITWHKTSLREGISWNEAEDWERCTAICSSQRSKRPRVPHFPMPVGEEQAPGLGPCPLQSCQGFLRTHSHEKGQHPGR